MKKTIHFKQGHLVIFFGMSLSGFLFTNAPSAELKIDEEVFQVTKDPFNITFWRSDWLDRHSHLIPLNAETLKNHLIKSGKNCFKELGRLILAQDRPEEHDLPQNNHFSYMDSYIQNDLCKATTFEKLINHMLNNGHLTYHPHPTTQPLTWKGVFNIASPFKQTSTNGSPVYAVSPQGKDNKKSPTSLKMTPFQDTMGAVYSLINSLFSSNYFNNIQIIDTYYENRFKLEATYIGDNIHGINYQQGHRPGEKTLGFRSNGTYTDRICVVVEVSYGTIYIVSLYPQG